MSERSAMAQAKSGLRLAGLTLLFLGVGGLFVAGVAYAFFPTGHSHALGWAFLIIATPVMVVEADRWARKLPGILGLAVLNGLIMVSTGHQLGKPSVPVSRLDALVATVFFAACSALSGTLRRRKLNWFDHIGLMGFVFSIAWLLGYDSIKVTSPGVPEPLGPPAFV